ncbi:thiamine phosphate synthase [Nocardioides sp. AE5]|uniref:thiamine phosphate synthase n=1 Tax=Nocardioides sp. AE5 TaxID=2962573 RepID=UPI0028828A1E|nr:thiamine phosphate synthase [Nocardioides sp. AE5]MDT0202212.1 thiamine phosphate synthase [Nocardioides sp. AE5]
MTSLPALPRLLLLTDRSQLRLGRGLVRTVTECVDAGLGQVVVREHDLAATARRALVAALADVPGLSVISSRIPDPAAHGFHEPARPAPCNAESTVLRTPPARCEVARTARYKPGEGVRGRSCHDIAEVRRAAAEGVDYVTLSPFATTPSKPGYGPPLDPSAYADHPIPVFALGGVTLDNAARAREAGAHGVAVMGAVMRADDPAAVVARLLEEVR